MRGLGAFVGGFMGAFVGVFFGMFMGASSAQATGEHGLHLSTRASLALASLGGLGWAEDQVHPGEGSA